RRLPTLSRSRSRVEQKRPANRQPNRSHDYQKVFLHLTISLKGFWKRIALRRRSLMRHEDGIALDVYPVGFLGGNMAALAVFRVVHRSLLVRRVGLEQRPSPSIAP